MKLSKYCTCRTDGRTDGILHNDIIIKRSCSKEAEDATVVVLRAGRVDPH